jgi:alpha-ketoglutarate-dependent taurine dioxygenase
VRRWRPPRGFARGGSCGFVAATRAAARAAVAAAPRALVRLVDARAGGCARSCAPFLPLGALRARVRASREMRGTAAARVVGTLAARAARAARPAWPAALARTQRAARPGDGARALSLLPAAPRAVSAAQDAVQVQSGRVEGERMVVAFEDGQERVFHAVWLRDMCPCPRCLTSSGQKVGRKVDDPALVQPEAASVRASSGGALQVQWADHEGAVSAYSGAFLRKFAYSGGGVSSEHAARSARAQYARQDRPGTLLPRLGYAHVMSGERGLWDWMSAMNRHGAVLITDSPAREGVVKGVANLVGPCSHTIYGETFDVIATPKPINIAYTDSALEPHMDLSYYESPPGVQFLHCVEFDAGVTGGDSTLIDGHAVAEEFQRREPALFKVLSTVPATFQKDHLARAHPLKMFYQRPHILTNYADEVTAVFWSPPFEGPLRVREELVRPYYEAYHAFRSLMLSDEMWTNYGAVFRMRPGDMLVFNNRRMLHGRNAFTSENGKRHLQGCYLDVDTYLNKFRVLATKMEPELDGVIAGPNEARFGISSHR